MDEWLAYSREVVRRVWERHHPGYEEKSPEGELRNDEMAQLAVGSDGISHAAAAASNHHGRSIRLVNQETPTKRARLQKDDDIEERKKKNRLPQKQKRKSARCFVRTSSKKGIPPSVESIRRLFVFIRVSAQRRFLPATRARTQHTK